MLQTTHTVKLRFSPLQIEILQVEVRVLLEELRELRFCEKKLNVAITIPSQHFLATEQLIGITQTWDREVPGYKHCISVKRQELFQVCSRSNQNIFRMQAFIDDKMAPLDNTGAIGRQSCARHFSGSIWKAGYFVIVFL